MTKFWYHNGLVDQAYTDVMESVYFMTDHAKKLHSSAGTRGLSLSRKRSPSTVQGISEMEKSLLLSGLMPDNMENLHRPMTALAAWNSGKAVPTQTFKSLGTVGPPAKRARVSSDLSSRVLDSETNEPRNISFPLNVRGSVDPRETQQEISDIIDVRNENDMTLTGQSMGQQTRISNWLSPIVHQTMHDSNGSQRYRETGVWLSETPEFKYWRDTSQSSIFWLHGTGRLSFQALMMSGTDITLAGVGKTVLSYRCLPKKGLTSI